MIVTLLIGCSFAYLAWSMIDLVRNGRRASSMGIPTIWLPVDGSNTIWIILEPMVWKILDLLPVNWGALKYYSRRGWYFGDKATAHLRYGPIWAIVTPRDVYVHVADPGAINDIFNRRKDFIRPPKMYSKCPCASYW
jgi:hypothetical protein